ncbi:hypothetical protein GWI33_004033 [Rhynchophorus ferrugineus]|uniref:Protein SZT2 n=1 Tax=Rhynchophorus ferrugineus TaxID=354439 RepID=A0A834MH14_RHYFE|nr:hypothetical protein GWI33_004033 [Rhynchophorus ferrugineus]
MLRHEKKLNHVCPISKLNNDDNIHWKCYIKGVSKTHVILTFLPASVEDVKRLTGVYINISSDLDEVEERAASRSSNISDVPINNPNSLCLPVYVYNCPSKLLVNVFVNSDNDKRYAAEDIYEDHRFVFQEDSLKPKDSSFYIPQEMPEPKNKQLQEHCKALTFTTSKCFTLSLFLALHNSIYIWDSDIQNAMDMCEEEYIEIDITKFMKNVCYHVKQSNIDLVPIQTLREAYPCRTFSNFHELIKKKFLKILCTSFYRVPSNGEYYYYKNLSSKSEEPPIDSDDETSICASDIEFRSDKEMSIYSEGPHLLTKALEGGVTDVAKMSDISPLFLHLICTVKYNSRDVTHTSVRVLPTCLGELIQKLETTIDHFDKSKLYISLDILCLTLPPNVQNILTDYPQHDIRTSSFCSDGFQRSISESSASSDFQVQLKFLTETQRKSVDRLRDEINWLLEDEICTSFLDTEQVTMEILHYIIRHVSDGYQTSPSCKMHKIDLNFVYSNNSSHKKFIQEFSKLPLPTGYKLCQVGEYYFVAKDKKDNDILHYNKRFSNVQNVLKEESDTFISRGLIQEDNTSQHSDISSISLSETEDGYDEDVSEDDEDWEWLDILSNKRPLLSNFWLILKIEENHVDCYFHCRFLELATNHVEAYKNIEGEVRGSIFNLCKRVNQLLLLQCMYESQLCNTLLEPDDNLAHDTSAPKITNKFRQTDPDLSDDLDITLSQPEASPHFTPGYFSCPVVWQKVFVLHPRLKTGTAGKTRGISALRLILDKFLVQNRNNMFVYKDKEENVFYLRLYESSNTTNSGLCMKSTDNDSTTFSRSPSIASLPIGQNSIPNLGVSEQSLPSLSSSDIRPRVRSFGEKEIRSYDSKEKLNEDTLILKVHGITPAGSELQEDLVQVLQNRLDDAVLEFLSIMLARNSMCPLTPEDVRFIQKPQQKPDYVFRFSIQNIVLQWRKTNSFILYLNHNLQHFLNIPKYIDNRPEYHFKDFCDEDDKNVLVSDNIFIYNQGQILSAGNRGIACIVLALILNTDPVPHYDAEQELENIFINKKYKDFINANIIENDEHYNSYLEFRVWKQGRINLDNLSKLLKLSVSQANWDIVTEYYLLKKPLCVKDYGECPYLNKKKVDVDSLDINLEKEVEYDCELDLNYNKTVRKVVTKSLPKKLDAHLYPTRKINKRTLHSTTLKASRVISYDLEKDNSFDTFDNGSVSMIYSRFLPSWLEFGHSMNTPSVKKNVIRLVNRHIPSIIVKELIFMLEDKPKSFRAISTSYLSNNNDRIYVPFIASNTIQKYIIISRGFQDSTVEDDIKNSQKFEPKMVNNILIPRRKIFWISVDNENILIYTYNWAKDSIDKLDQKCRNLANWLSVRSCYLNSVISQKLGLFHNQPLTRKCFKLSTNNYYSLIGNLEAIFRFPRDYQHKKSPSTFNLPTILEAFRDNFYHSKYIYNDVAVIFTIEMKEMKSLEKKNREEMKKLHSMYQSRTGITSVPQLNLLMQNCRIIHYVNTPLLFLPRWRLKSASTRDHSLYYPSQAIQLSDIDEEREFWHTELCYAFFCDYKNYLHTLGFTPLQIDNSQSSAGIWTKDKSFYNSVFYIQRTILGGILIFTVSFEEPFFVVKLHAIECNRLQNITSRTSNSFTLSFLDECDKVKVLMHLHSFTYDYHLRSIYNYISGNIGKLTEKYNVHQFLDDFLKYYNKAPNYARNLVHTDTLTIDNLVTEGKQLYDYLRLNVQQYGFKVLETDVGSSNFILVQVSTARQISYKDSQERKHTDDFDMTLVVYNLCAPYKSTDNVLHLKYYLILTSKRDTYPMYESEQKLGKFRTVSSSLQLEASCPNLESSADDTDPRTSDDGSQNTSLDDAPMSKVHNTMIIRQEPVTYLGYYSPHEQIMHQLIMEKAKSTQNDIRDMVYKGMEHCRTTLLWNRLISPQESNQLTFEEFIELKRLAKLRPLYDLHPNLQPLLNQPLQWYQGLAKLLLVKYSDQHRIYSSTDGNVYYYVILHPRYYGAFMMLSLDLHTARGELHAVYREPHKQEDADPLGIGYEKTLRDGFVYCISFYLWSGMISN